MRLLHRNILAFLLGWACVCRGAYAEVVAPADQVRPDLPMAILNSSPAIADLNGDGYNEIIVVATTPPDLYVQKLYVFDGATNYATLLLLPGNWPQEISDDEHHWILGPTPAVGDINFDGKPEILVGGLKNLPLHGDVLAFDAQGNLIPGWGNVMAAAAPFFNAAAFGDVNADGSPDLVVVDESTYLQRYGALGRKWQCQYVADPVLSSPAFGDVGQGGESPGQLADGIPDLLAQGTGSSVDVSVYDSLGTNLDNWSADLLFARESDTDTTSSPALVDLDGDGTQDIVTSYDAGCVWVGCQGLRVWASGTGEVPSEYPLDSGSPVIQDLVASFTYAYQYSSPAIISNLNASREYRIAVGSDGGKLYVLRYDRNTKSLVDAPEWAGGIELDSGYSISSSPVAADLTGDGLSEIVVGTDAGNIHVLGPTGQRLATFSCGVNESWPWDNSAAIISTVAIGSGQTDGTDPILVVGNRRGLFVVHLNPYGFWPTFNPQNASWPTFHGNNARTGSAGSYALIPTRGSIGGVIPNYPVNMTIKLLQGQPPLPVPDPDQNYPKNYEATPASDGRFVFEMLPPGNYVVHVVMPGVPETLYAEVPVTVVAGQMSRVLTRLYVNAGAPSGTQNGLNWDHAIRDLTEALETADANPTIREIWVVGGTYRPDGGTNDRSMSFVLSDKVSVYGGFAGNETLLSQRNITAHPTILSGDIGVEGENHHHDDSRHVVTIAHEAGRETILDGFTIQYGRADLADDDCVNGCGGGVWMQEASPTIRNCRFENDHAGDKGGAVYSSGGSPVISRCTFLNNTAGGTGGLGGGIAFSGAPSNPVVMSCVFVGNGAGDKGGAIYNIATDLIVGNCVFKENGAVQGGAIYNGSLETPANLMVGNCTLSYNSSGIYYCPQPGVGLSVYNSIVWGNGGGSIAQQIEMADGSPMNVQYSCVQDYIPDFGGGNNISSSPIFADADLRLRSISPAQNAGSYALVLNDLADLDSDGNVTEKMPLDLDGVRRFYAVVDMGAYELQKIHIKLDATSAVLHPVSKLDISNNMAPILDHHLPPDR